MLRNMRTKRSVVIRFSWLVPAISGLFMAGVALGLIFNTAIWLGAVLFGLGLGLGALGLAADKRFFIWASVISLLGLGFLRTFLDTEAIERALINFSRPLLDNISYLKKGLSQSLAQFFFAPVSNLLRALILGERSALSYDFLQTLNNTGTRHIVAISGLHIGIIGGVLWGLTKALPIKRGLQVGLLLSILVIYVIMVGAPPSAVRAAIMAGVFVLSLALSRGVRLWHSLLAAALIMVLIEPSQLSSISFQFSFMAVAGILAAKPLMDRLLKILPNPLKLRDLLSISLAVLIFLWPLLTFYFGRLSIISPLANMAAVPFLPVLIVGGFLSAVFGLFWPDLGGVLAWPIQKIGELVINLLTGLSAFPYASFKMPNFLFLVIAYYIVLAALVIWLRFFRQSDTI